MAIDFFLLWNYGQFLPFFVLLLYHCGSILSVQIVITMAMWPLQASIFILMTIATSAQSTYLAAEVVYWKLEHALITDSKLIYLMQNTFFPCQGSPWDIIIIHVNVTVGGMLPRTCSRHSHSPGTPNTTRNFSGAVLPYSTSFQWISY